MLEQAESDVLILLDCCCGASSAAEAGNGVTEVIAACGFETWAPGVGQHSFTRTLIDELGYWSNDACQSVAMLHMRVLSSMKHIKPRTWNSIREEQRKTPIYSVLSNEGAPRSIELKPLTQRVPHVVELPTSSTVCPASAAGTLDHPLSGLTQHSLSQVWPDPEFKYPKVLISLALDEDQWLSTGRWAEWLSSVPAVATSAKVEGIYKSDSTLVLLSLPVAIWDMLPEDSAVKFLGFVRSENLMHAMDLASEPSPKRPKKHPVKSTVPKSAMDADPLIDSSKNKGTLPSWRPQLRHELDVKVFVPQDSEPSQSFLASLRAQNFWKCCNCQNINNAALSPERCITCGHRRCIACTGSYN